MKKMKLNDMNSSLLDDYEMRKIRGGGVSFATMLCSCACKYANSGGSSTGSNGNANDANGLSSPGTKCFLDMTIEELGEVKVR